MNKLFTFLAGAAVIAMSSCSDDKLVGEGNTAPVYPETEDGVYFTVNIALPTSNGSRSVTDNPNNGNSASDVGVEIGKDRENRVSSAVIVLANTNNGFIAAAEILGQDLQAGTTGKNPSYKAQSSFSKTQLQAYYDSGSEIVTEGKANIFVFCNPTQQLKNILFGIGTTAPAIGSTDWTNAILDITESAIWSDNNFLMSNSKIATRLIPTDIAGWNYYTTPDKAFDLSGINTPADGVSIDNLTDGRGAIQVERAAARFDFRDASPNGDFTYPVMYDKPANEEGRTLLINVTLQKMALVNMNKNFYALRRVSADGLPTGAEICKPEQPWSFSSTGEIIVTSPGNYVVDANYEWKTTTLGNINQEVPFANPVDFTTGFQFPFFNNDGSIDNTNISAATDRWATYLCSDVVKSEADNDESWNNGTTYSEYKIWRYATENVVVPINKQKNGLSTGIVFKAKMTSPEDLETNANTNIAELAKTLNNKDESFGNHETAPILYRFADNIFVSFPKMRDAAIMVASGGFKQVGDQWFPKIENFNRSNPLYVAVFGTGGFGSFDIMVDGKKVGTYVDKLAEVDCANKAWNAWNKADKPDSTNPLTVAFKKAFTDAKITLYQRSYDNNYGWGYYCYYYYWNRHNDNGNNGIMGPMEFAVVRNNVYKLAVTKISRLGHPRISENDPDKPTPNTDEEEDNVYITVTSEILPWVVRVNNIEF